MSNITFTDLDFNNVITTTDYNGSSILFARVLNEKDGIYKEMEVRFFHVVYDNPTGYEDIISDEVEQEIRKNLEIMSHNGTIIFWIKFYFDQMRGRYDK